MSQRPGGHLATVAAWILVVALIVAGVFGVVGGILSPSIVIDLAALWPLLVVIVLVGVAARFLGKRRRTGPILPLTVFSVLLLGAALHLGAWDQLPSASARLTGPDPAGLSDPTELLVQLSGDLEMSAGNGPAYDVRPIVRGGRVGVPQATETSVDGAVSIRIEADPEAPSWYTFAGWTVELSPQVTWRLVLNGTLDADLTALTLSSAAIAGSGLIRLGSPPEGGASVIVAGDFDVVVPSGSAVTVRGNAVTPSNWAGEGDVSRSPVSAAAGDWSITVQGDATPRIREG